MTPGRPFFLKDTPLHGQRLAHEAVARREDHAARDLVAVAVGGRAAVLHVPALLEEGFARDTDRRATIRHSISELVDRAGLMLAGQTLLVAW